MAAHCRDIVSLTDHTNKLTKSLVERFETLLALLATDDTSYSATAVSEYQIELELSLLTSSVEDILRTIRQMQELWLFGKLDTISNRPPAREIAQEEKGTILQLLSLIERPDFFPALSDRQLRNDDGAGVPDLGGRPTGTPAGGLTIDSALSSTSRCPPSHPFSRLGNTTATTPATANSVRTQVSLDEERFQSNVREMELLELGDIAGAFSFTRQAGAGLDGPSTPPGFERFDPFGRLPTIDDIGELGGGEYYDGEAKGGEDGKEV